MRALRMFCLIVAAGLYAAPLTLTGCHTIEGVGKDVQAAGGAISETGEAVSDTAEENNPYRR